MEANKGKEMKTKGNKGTTNAGEDKAYMRWGLEMERVLADILRDERSLGHKGDGGWKTIAYTTASSMLTAKFKTPVSVDNVKNRVKAWKKIYGVVSGILSQSGLSWDGGKYMISVDDENIWNDYIKVTVVPGQGITFQDMDIFHGHLVFFLQKERLPLFCSINMPIHVNHEQPMNVEDLDPWFFPVPSSLCSIVSGSNHDFMSSTYRVVISSPVMPDVMVDYDMTKRKFTVLHQEEVVGLNGNKADSYAENSHSNLSQVKTENSHSDLSQVNSYYDRLLQSAEDSQMWSDLSEAFSCERREVISHDGVTVPVTILYSRRAQRNGQSPGILHGYGAYGEVLDKSWCSDHISLLTRGWVLAYADVRGGGGDASWHKDGTGSRKLNSIYDFAACGLYLVNEGYVHKNRLGAFGCSAGGLLVGATINMYPDLFSAAILKVPFLDICNTMLDPSLPLTIMDYEEFGDPRIRTEFETIHSYSPYDNIRPGACYPSMLVTASFHDSRVGVWEAAKWVARMRENTCPTCSQSVILKTDMKGGHFSEGGRFLHCEDAAFDYAFLIKVMGMLDDEKQSEVL